MGHQAADGVKGVVGKQEIHVGSTWAEGVVGWKTQLLTLLPPAILRGNNFGVQGGIELDPSHQRLKERPFNFLNAQTRSHGEVYLQERLRRRAPQSRDVAVLLAAERHQSEESGHQRVSWATSGRL